MQQDNENISAQEIGWIVGGEEHRAGTRLQVRAPFISPSSAKFGRQPGRMRVRYAMEEMTEPRLLVMALKPDPQG